MDEEIRTEARQEEDRRRCRQGHKFAVVVAGILGRADGASYLALIVVSSFSCCYMARA